MGSVSRKRVTNVFDVPQDILVNFIGKGLYFNREDKPPLLEVSAGSGLNYDAEGNLAVDAEVDDSQTSNFSVCVGTSLSLDGQKISLTKAFADYKILRNSHGLVVDIKLVEERQEVDEVILTDVSYTSALSIPTRDDSAQFPNFYKK